MKLSVHSPLTIAHNHVERIMEKEVAVLLSQHSELEYKRDTGKVRCSLSGHEMPCCLEVVQSYIGGRKFARLKAQASVDCATLEPFIIPSVQRKNMLFCALTNCYINCKPDEVKHHISGKKYTRALQRHNAGELKQLFEEKKRRKSGAGGDSSKLSKGSQPAAVQGEAVPFWVDEESGSENGGMELEDALEGSEDRKVEEAKAEDRAIKRRRKKHKLMAVSAPTVKKAKVRRPISEDALEDGKVEEAEAEDRGIKSHRKKRKLKDVSAPDAKKAKIKTSRKGHSRKTGKTNCA